MAIYKIFPSQDSTLYSNYPSMNAGVDAILEISNTNATTTASVARSIIEFNNHEINSTISSLINTTDYQVNLKCFLAKVNNINQPFNIEVYPLSSSWSNGSGRYLDSPKITDGVSWTYRNPSLNTEWISGSNYPLNITSSYNQVEGGGVWYVKSEEYNNNLIEDILITQSFDYRYVNDLDVDVTSIVKLWNNNVYSNDGFILKLDKTTEFSIDTTKQPNIKFFSIDTNTIYPPQLEFKWDDSQYNTGDLPEIATNDLYLSLDNNPGIFNVESVNRFRLNVRPEYPTRTYQTSSLYTTNHYLPTSSYYGIKDLDTNEFVINFDENYTKISCDEKGNYFDIYMNGLEPERYYKILIKTNINNSTIVKDEKYYFKITNG